MKRVEDESFRGRLPHQENDLCLCYDIDMDDNRPLIEQALVEVGIADVLRIRKVKFTNKAYPEENNLQLLRDIRKVERYKPSFIAQHAVLVCRRKLISMYDSATHRLQIEKCPSHFVEMAIKPLDEDECSSGAFVSPQELRCSWRGETVAGRSYTNTQALYANRSSGDGATKPPRVAPKCTFQDLTSLGDSEKNNTEVQKARKKGTDDAASPGMNRRTGVRMSRAVKQSQDTLEQMYTFADACKLPYSTEYKH